MLLELTECICVRSFTDLSKFFLQIDDLSESFTYLETSSISHFWWLCFYIAAMTEFCSLVIKTFDEDCLFLFKENCSLLVIRLSTRVIWKPLLLVAIMEKFLKSSEWLQNRINYLTAEFPSSLVLFPRNPNIPKNSHILTLNWNL